MKRKWRAGNLNFKKDYLISDVNIFYYNYINLSYMCNNEI
jgi:hypothetical protein